ncbi:DinB family protein [Paenibacillus sp. WLX1005]|uniref:DinB family protein n=1 Tax=Paenibacillus sp. WLX1005 TaxID=3243766 RepID=UPI0039843763
MYPNQYQWVRQTRAILLHFCGELSSDDFTRCPEHSSQSIRDILVHIADCYDAWLGSYILLQTKTPITPKENLSSFDVAAIQARFAQVDHYVDQVLQTYVHKMDEPIQRNIPWREGNETISMTPSKLLMHTITHEFHHKGQLMAIARRMGYVPPNTDILGTKD